MLTANLEFPDDESPDFFLLEVGNGSPATCSKFFTAGVWGAELTANLEFPDNESPDFFPAGISNDAFRGRVTDFKGIENTFSGEGVDGAEIPRKAFRLSCSGEVGAEWMIREAGKAGTLEREVGGLTGRAKGDMGRTRGRGLSGRDEL